MNCPGDFLETCCFMKLVESFFFFHYRAETKPNYLKRCLQDKIHARGGGGGVLPYMGYIGMCRCEGYGFQAVYSRIGYINQSVWL